ncbi:MAG: SIMPL domain-containing protein [Phycisphaerales bacterium]
MMRSLALAVAAALAVLSPAAAQDKPALTQQAIPTISVMGEGQVSVEPDLAVVRLGMFAQEKEAGAAQGRVNETMQRVIAAIRQAGVPAEQVQTSGLSLTPIFTHRQPRPNEEMPPEPRITGYRAEMTVTARLKDLKRAGPVIDGALQAGANTLQGISFELQDETKAKSEALRRAVVSARAKARAMADGVGVELAQLMEASEGGAQVFRPMYDMAMRSEMAGMAQTPIEAGQLQVTASVTLRYRISGAGVGAPDRAEDGRPN